MFAKLLNLPDILRSSGCIEEDKKKQQQGHRDSERTNDGEKTTA